jgi:hypothetical protein
MKGNFHVRFLGGKGGAIRPTQPPGEKQGPPLPGVFDSGVVLCYDVLVISHTRFL